MNRRKLFWALMAACTVLLTGCGETEHVIQNEQPASGEESLGQAESPAEGNEQTTMSAKTGYVFVSGNVTVSVDADAAPVTEALGEPNSYYEAASCAFEGMDKFYTYNGFELETYPMNGKDFISVIVLKDDSVTTLEGAAIGNSRENVQEIYGTEFQENGNLLTYEKDDMKLCFILNNNEVLSIEYRSNVLE